MKERLTGAIILVAVLVLLVPELLSGPGERTSTRAESAESSAPLRSYTIDLADDASRRATAPTSAPTMATDEPVVAATPEPEDAGSDESATAMPGAGVPTEAGGTDSSTGSGVANARGNEDGNRASGSGADRAAATPPSATADSSRDATRIDGNATRGASPGVEDDQPRSAFGPNAVQRPKPTPPSDSSRAQSSAARVANAPSSRTGSSEPSRPAASDAKPTKGWAVQLGVFASRENADRLAKQVKGKGYTVSVNETTGNGKRLYRVRVGPAASRTAAVELGAKLRAAGYTGAVVALP